MTKGQMESTRVEKILSDKQFLKELDQAIESGKSVDYGWDGENETSEMCFETDTARDQVVELLKKYFIQKKMKAIEPYDSTIANLEKRRDRLLTKKQTTRVVAQIIDISNLIHRWKIEKEEAIKKQK